jgi:pimeloyl-ACP methyl ester carboxylesterase
VLQGHHGGEGAPALLLHGGAAVPDYMGGCAQLLDGLFETIRYTQRGTPPSEGGPPYTIEAHMADALAVLDLFELERAWAIGDSRGGQLALHLLVTRRSGCSACSASRASRALRPHVAALLRAAGRDGAAAAGAGRLQASIETNRSLAEHFERGTLERGLPAARLPALFVHGEDDPMPLGETASLIPGVRVETIPNAGHFPWLERPEAFRRAVERLLASVD